jgi:beta-ureidopropionase
MSSIRVASCAIMPTKWDIDGNTEKMLGFMERALAGCPDLIMTPEGCLEGYVVNDAIKQDRLDEMMELAEPEDGPYVERFREFCRANSVNALIGLLERVGDKAYNTALWIDRNGETAGKYSKTHFQEGIRDDRPANTPGDEIKGFDTEFGRVGVMICFDRRVPEVARSLMLDGARILLIPSYGFYQGVNDAVLATRAHENDLPLLFCHPNKTIAFLSQGDLLINHEEMDAITHVELELADADSPSPGGMRSRRRPDVYGKIVAHDRHAQINDR